MPLVHIDLMEGRTADQIEKMIASVSEAIAMSLDAPISSVRIVVNELQPHQYGVGGKAWPAVLEERRRAEEGET